MLHPSFIEKRISQILDHLTFTKEYIYNYSIFEAPEFKKQLKDNQVASVYIEYIFESNFDLIKLFELLHDEVEFLANILDKNGIKMMFDDLKKCKKCILEKCDKDRILNTIDTYNTEQLRMAEVMKLQNQEFEVKLIDLKNLVQYFENLAKMKSVFSKQMDQLISKFDKGKINSNVVVVGRKDFDCKYALDELCTAMKESKQESRDKHKVEKNNPDYFKMTNGALKKIDELYITLKNNGFIDRKTTSLQFVRHFKMPDADITVKKIRWLKSKTHLRYFIIQLFPFLQNTKDEIWAVTINRFLDKNHNSLQAAQLSGTKSKVPIKIEERIDAILMLFDDDCVYRDRYDSASFPESKRAINKKDPLWGKKKK